MFEKIGRLAEVAATNVSLSRRGFFGRLGQSALGVVGVLAGFAATAATARAGTGGGYVCCTWKCSRYGRSNQFYKKVSFCYPPYSNCGSRPPCSFGGVFVRKTTVSSCSQCN